MPRPEDPIMDMANNIEELYLEKEDLYAKWVDQAAEDEWDEGDAWTEAKELAVQFSDAIENIPWVQKFGYRYGDRDIREAASEMIDEFKAEYLETR